MWEIDFTGQIAAFGYSLLAGALFCLPYDIMRAVEVCFIKNRAAMFLMDVFYFLATGLLTFLLLHVTCNGEVRGFVFAGELIGFLLVRKLLSPSLRRGLGFLFRGIQRVSSTTKKVLFRVKVKKTPDSAEIFEKKEQKS